MYTLLMRKNLPEQLQHIILNFITSLWSLDQQMKILYLLFFRKNKLIVSAYFMNAQLVQNELSEHFKTFKQNMNSELFRMSL